MVKIEIWTHAAVPRIFGFRCTGLGCSLISSHKNHCKRCFPTGFIIVFVKWSWKKNLSFKEHPNHFAEAPLVVWCRNWTWILLRTGIFIVEQNIK